PALFTSTSMWSYRSPRDSARQRALSTEHTSSSSPSAARPSARRSRTTVSTASARRPVTTTRYPLRANAVAVARPIPRVAPVTTTIFSAISVLSRLLMHFEQTRIPARTLAGNRHHVRLPVLDQPARPAADDHR